ncbi:MAG: carboxypeptidase regulatory-like domain-containing protein [Terriglobales bacterium]
MKLLRARGLGWLAVLVLGTGMLWAQSNSTGAITGTVTDPSGAVVPGATVHLDQLSHNVHLAMQASSSGQFTFQHLQPGAYKVTVSAKGFKTQTAAVIVQVGQVSSLPSHLQVGSSSTTVEVTGAANAVQVNTSTATVAGIVGREQIQQLPSISRNFLDLAQLQPGVQLVDGGNFDPTKNGFAGLSVEGAEGRTTEINVNGLDITDQTVGTTTMNIPDNSIQEFQVSQSSGDTSSDIGNTGQVNIDTRTGTNKWHGGGFAVYRGAPFAANPTLTQQKPPFKQNDDGLSLGGPLWQNKLFFFVSGERRYSDEMSSVDMPDFPNFTGFFPTPGEEKMGDARLDWQATSSLHVYDWYNIDSAKLVPPSVVGGTSLQPFQNENVSPSNELTVAWSTARFTNEFHYGHLDMFNHIISVPVPGVPNFPVGIDFDTGESFGPNLLAPQHTFQINDEFKYDGSAYFGSHTLRYGVELNHIAVDVYAAFFASGPQVSATYASGLTKLKAAGGDPLNPLDYYGDAGVTFGNGLGYFSNLPVHGNPFGGVYNFRKAFYIADTWQIRPNLTLNYGVHFERDPGEVNTDLAHPAVIGENFPQFAQAAAVPNNWSPTAGLVWDPTGHGKTVIRIGAGMYYENDINNNVMFERSNYISNSIAPGFPSSGSGGQPVKNATGACVFLCAGSGQSLTTQTIGSLAPAMQAAQTAIQSSYAALPQTPLANPAILAGGSATALVNGDGTPGSNNTGNPLFDDTYRTPYSVQFNAGVQHQFAQGVVLSANFVSNRGFDLLMIEDENQVGNSRYLNKAVAAGAIGSTATDLGVAQGTTPGATMDNLVAAIGSTCNCPKNKTLNGKTLTQVDVQGDLLGGDSAGFSIGGGANGTIGSPSYAFGGINPNFGNMSADRNLGMSNYRALQVQLLIQRPSLLRWIHGSSMTISYALGRLDATQFDQSFAPVAIDNENPRMFYGPNGYDRTSQLSIGGIFNLPWGIMFSTVNHFDSGMPQTPTLSRVGLGSGEIFATDWTGDGTTGDVLPGANLGAYNRSLGPNGLQQVITAYNTTYAGMLTPAGKALVNAGLANVGDLQALGLVMPYAASVTNGQLTPDSFLDSDIKITRAFRVGEHLTITPEIQCFNVFNVGNYDPPGDIMSGTIATGYDPAALGFGNPGSITDSTGLDQVRKYGLNTGVFAEGIPRAFEGGISFTF